MNGSSRTTTGSPFVGSASISARKNASARVLWSPADRVFLKLGSLSGVSLVPISTWTSLIRTQKVEFR